MTPQLKKVQRLDSIKTDCTYFTNEGYLIDHPILTTCGIFEYTNADGSIHRELRLPEHVFAENSLASYKGKPIIITHDAGVVNKYNVEEEQIGTIMSNGYRDGDNVKAEIIIHNTDAMKQCGLKELSLGYNLDLLEEPGTFNGEPYDAIQTNIVINHLALVGTARAGEQARLNIDGSQKNRTIKGGKVMGKNATKKQGASSKGRTGKDSKLDGSVKLDSAVRLDSSVLSPEELDEAIAMYCEAKGIGQGTDDSEVALDAEETIAQVRENKDRRDSENEPEDVDGAMKVIAQQDADIESLLSVIEQLQAGEGIAAAADGDGDDDNTDGDVNDDGDEDTKENTDDSDNNDKSINADSADKLIQQRLAVCRIGDKLNMDGLETMPLIQAKKAIIKKVLPSMKLDGRSEAYISAAYDIAAEKANSRKGTDYQKMQMHGGVHRADNSNKSGSAADARKGMIARREGGNQ